MIPSIIPSTARPKHLHVRTEGVVGTGKDTKAAIPFGPFRGYGCSTFFVLAEADSI